MRFLFLTWSEVDRMARKLGEKIKKSGFEPDSIVAISRGGFPVARILSDELGTLLLSSLQVRFYRAPGKTEKRAEIVCPLNLNVRGQKVLVVDDVSDTGESLALAVRHVEAKRPEQLRTATLHYKPWSRFRPHYFVKETRSWVVYPWERKETLESFKQSPERATTKKKLELLLKRHA